jgi:hypothetical protein
MFINNDNNTSLSSSTHVMEDWERDINESTQKCIERGDEIFRQTKEAFIKTAFEAKKEFQIRLAEAEARKEEKTKNVDMVL